MKKKNLKIFSLVLVALIITGCGCNKKKETPKEEPKNPNAPVIKYEEVGNLKFGTASFYISDETTYITVSVINDKKNDIKVNEFKILLKDREGKVIKSLDQELGVLKAGETREINRSIDEKLFNIATIDYEIK